ncbi:MAG TPA: retropepsin-like aspartic protease [Candidatus Baltobacteraceae bacterium]|nr:retropepsin-like aspartic protease [Candidatus Baltobacteraceae bacterium]
MPRLTVFLTVVLTVLSISAPSRAADDAAAALLAKHHAFAGWQLGDGTFKTLRLTREYANERGAVIRRRVELRIGLGYRNINTNLERNVSYEDGFTGNIFWNSSWNGFTTPEYGDAAKYDLTYAAFFNEGLDTLPGTIHGSDTVAGTTVQIVRLSVPSGDVIDLYIDPASGACLQAVIDPGGEYETTINAIQYAEVLPGKQMIHSFRFGGGRPYVYAKIEPNVLFSDQELHPPAPSATWSFSNPQPFPFKVSYDRFYVDAAIDGVPGRFILDTGSSSIYLTQRFAAKVKLKTLWSSTTLGGAIGSEAVKSDVVKLDTVTIGGNTLSNVLAELNRSNFNGDTDAPDGLIGFDLFGGALVTLDTAASTMTIRDPSTELDTSQGITVLADLSAGVPIVPMKLNGSIDVRSMLDSGTPEHVLFSHELISRYGLRMAVDNSGVGYLQSHLYFGGVAGTDFQPAECGHLDSLALGPIQYAGVNGCSTYDLSGRDVLVGFDFLKHFNIIFDYPHARMVMIPHKD